jgi:predicted transcriptional regulator
MAPPPVNPGRLSRMELQILQVLWELRSASIREIQAALPPDRQVEYTTVQTLVYRLEKKEAVQRIRKVGHAHIFAPLVSPKSAVGSMIDDILALFGGSAAPVVSHMAESGQLTLEDLKALETAIKTRSAKKKPKKS